MSAVLPTGFGKSLCFQYLPYLFDRLFQAKDHSIVLIVTQRHFPKFFCLSSELFLHKPGNELQNSLKLAIFNLARKLARARSKGA